MPDREGSGNRAPAVEVRAMFDRIASRYELMNTIMTLGMDAAWRRRAVRAARLGPGMRAVDVACGTGSLTRELARAIGARGAVTGVDLSEGMLAMARRTPSPRGVAEPRYVEGDALALPLADASADAATIAFGLRNVSDYRRCLAEMARVVGPGGRVVVLEIAMPAGRVAGILSATWFSRVVPFLGRLVGAAEAYRYLPQSVRSYPTPDDIAALLRDVGLTDVGWRRLAPGLVTLHVGRRAG
jgi:demethylmenaquinone methyltransferase/2-methoxy-6-polyprenyl-1,4-benzoquinol methylase